MEPRPCIAHRRQSTTHLARLAGFEHVVSVLAPLGFMDGGGCPLHRLSQRRQPAAGARLQPCSRGQSSHGGRSRTAAAGPPVSDRERRARLCGRCPRAGAWSLERRLDRGILQRRPIPDRSGYPGKCAGARIHSCGIDACSDCVWPGAGLRNHSRQFLVSMFEDSGFARRPRRWRARQAIVAAQIGLCVVLVAAPAARSHAADLEGRDVGFSRRTS